MTYKKKLIEVALPLAAISESSAKERLVKRGKPSSVHLWWARRPFVSARAVLWASLVDDPSSNPEEFPTDAQQAIERERLFEILIRLTRWEASNDQQVLEEAKREILRSCRGATPTIVDPFGGGGTIPLESVRLGLDTVSGDLNPVAVLVQRGMLSIPYQFKKSRSVHPRSSRRTVESSGRFCLADDVVEYGADLRSAAHDAIGHAYPQVELPTGGTAGVIAWLWARTVPSPDPSWSGMVPLVGNWIVRAKGSACWILPSVDSESRTIRYGIATDGEVPAGTVSRSGATCLATGTPMPFAYIREMAKAGKMGVDLIGVVASGSRSRLYVAPTAEQAETARFVVPEWRPESELQGKARQNVSLYGMDRFDQLFTERQLATLGRLSASVADVRLAVLRDAVFAGMADDGIALRDGGDGATAYADAIATYLGFAIDRLADWNNSLCRWENKAQVPQQLFAGHSMPMVWDFAEANPFSESTGSLHATLNTIASSLRALPDADRGARVENRHAASLAVEEVGAVFASDPPYYANINYADLADFFYVWLRRSVGAIWPDECATLLTPKSDEIIANLFTKSSHSAQAHFEDGMAQVLAAIASSQHLEFPATMFYAYKQEEDHRSGRASTGWETFLQGLVDAGFVITATWPIRTENRSRLMAANSNSLASSIVLAFRVRGDVAMATRGEFLSQLRSELRAAVRVLQVENIAPVDMAQSAVGPGIAVFSRYAKVVEADGSSMSVRTALALINGVLEEVLSGEESEFDSETRFALTWFEQYGHNPASFGDADSLARAKDTSVQGIVEAGLVASRDGKVRLLERSELSEEWDPATDDRLTVWESTQYLIRALESSETVAAALLARMGDAYGERARQLAYLLYGLCDRKKWADDAGAYNMLVTAWPELLRLAAIQHSAPAGDAEGRLF